MGMLAVFDGEKQGHVPNVYPPENIGIFRETGPLFSGRFPLAGGRLWINPAELLLKRSLTC
jgi:hypothetical protein